MVTAPSAPPRSIVVDPQPSFPFAVARLVRVGQPFPEWWCEDFAGNLVARWADAPPCPFGDGPCEVQHLGGEWTWVRKDLPVLGKLTGVVLEPGVSVAPGSSYSIEEIRELADRFLQGFRAGDLRVVEPAGITPLESWVTERNAVLDGRHVTAGTWLLRVAVHDEKLWEQLRTDPRLGKLVIGTGGV